MLFRSYHELECQGLSRITSTFPEFDLRPLAKEAAAVLPRGRKETYPEYVGGERVKLLLGIKSTALAPVLLHRLPNGLGIYKSALVDAWGSTICYGGTHAVFTEGYSRAGLKANFLQVLLTQQATAYMRSPYVFINTEIDNHGPKNRIPKLCLSEDMFPEQFEEWCGVHNVAAPQRMGGEIGRAHV